MSLSVSDHKPVSALFDMGVSIQLEKVIHVSSRLDTDDLIVCELYSDIPRYCNIACVF